MFCLIWLLDNYFYDYGLLYASITSSVVLSNTTPIWVYALSISCFIPLLHREKFNVLKALMVTLSLSGFILIAL